MITFIKRAERRFNHYEEDYGVFLAIEISFHYGHNKYMYELYNRGVNSRGYKFDTYIDAMDAVCSSIGREYRIMDWADLELESALFEEIGE